MGNLSSVRFACEAAGLDAVVTSAACDLWGADGIILPGVGAFGSAMEALRSLDLVCPLRDLATAKPLMGVCLGMQLLMTESEEFGVHQGLGILEGSVVRLDRDVRAEKAPKIPHVGWNSVFRTMPAGDACGHEDGWTGSLLAGLRQGVSMYFVHSFQVIPASPEVRLAMTRYEGVEFCSAIRHGRVTAFQFHPERSGEEGLRVYRNLASWLQTDAAGTEEMNARDNAAIAC